MDKIEYNSILRGLMQNPPDGFQIMASPCDDTGCHPEDFIDYECVFAAEMLKEFHPMKILDIGSYRNFIMGLAAHYDVTSVDIRPRSVNVVGEDCLIGDAKKLPVESGRFDAVVSLCSLEHFGLGRYGDEFDLDADRKAFLEMIRVLRPGGRLIFSTTIGPPCICFNAHRIYSQEMIADFCVGLKLITHRICRKGRRLGFLDIGKQTRKLGNWDVYLGCWQKEL